MRSDPVVFSLSSLNDYLRFGQGSAYSCFTGTLTVHIEETYIKPAVENFKKSLAVRSDLLFGTSLLNL